MTGELDRARQDAGLSHGELWLRYFELGGMRAALEVEAYLYGALAPSDHDHDVVVHALNERFVELGGNHPVPYSDSNSTYGPGDQEADGDGTGDGDRAAEEPGDKAPEGP